METLKNKTEQELRKFKVGFNITLEDFNTAFKELTERQHDYGTCVYAMSILAEMAFNLTSSKLGVTGFQASCADLDFIRRTRRMEAGFKILNFQNLLYPQYRDSDFIETFDELLVKHKDTLKPIVKKKLEEDSDSASKNVIAHWRYIMSL